MSRDIQRFSIVTTCFNAEPYIADTVRSVIEQTAVRNGRVELEYIIVDGQSSDDTVSIIKSFNHPAIRLVSEPDEGFHDGLSKGLRQVDGDVVAYLNAGDYYHPCAFDVVREVMSENSIEWLTGLTVAYNDRAQITGVRLPYRYRSSFIRHGLHDNIRLPYIQQESTFWSGRLHRSLDLNRLASFSCAGDAFLWNSLAQQVELYIVESCLGGFRSSPGQISEDQLSYRRELKDLSANPTLALRLGAALERPFWYMPDWTKRMLNRGTLVRCDPDSQQWRIGLGARSRRSRSKDATE